MLEQFRILRAAARLGEFTIPQLAAASGVSKGTVQKTLRRKPSLFVKSDARAPGPHGRRVRLFRLETENLAAELQAAANAAPASSAAADNDVSRNVAADILLVALPNASVTERRLLLEAAADELTMTPLQMGGEAMALAGLHAGLAILVSIQEWLSRFPPIEWPTVHIGNPALAAREQLIHTIEDVLSAKRRAARDRDLRFAEQCAAGLLEAPQLVFPFAVVLPDSVPSPPAPTWAADLVAALWSTASDPLWRPVAGDLTAPRRLAAAIAAPTPIASGTGAVRSAQALFQRPSLPTLGEFRTIILSAPLAGEAFLTLNTGRLTSGDEEAWKFGRRKARWGTIISHEDESALETMVRIRLSAPYLSVSTGR